jgi:hypothetical protein
MPTYFPNNDCARKSLGHMIDSHQLLENAKRVEDQVATTSKNPYEESMEEMIG